MYQSFGSLEGQRGVKISLIKRLIRAVMIEQDDRLGKSLDKFP